MLFAKNNWQIGKEKLQFSVLPCLIVVNIVGVVCYFGISLCDVFLSVSNSSCTFHSLAFIASVHKLVPMLLHNNSWKEALR